MSHGTDCSEPLGPQDRLDLGSIDFDLQMTPRTTRTPRTSHTPRTPRSLASTRQRRSYCGVVAHDQNAGSTPEARNRESSRMGTGKSECLAQPNEKGRADDRHEHHSCTSSTNRRNRVEAAAERKDSQNPGSDSSTPRATTSQVRRKPRVGSPRSSDEEDQSRTQASAHSENPEATGSEAYAEFCLNPARVAEGPKLTAGRPAAKGLGQAKASSWSPAGIAGPRGLQDGAKCREGASLSSLLNEKEDAKQHEVASPASRHSAPSRQGSLDPQLQIFFRALSSGDYETRDQVFAEVEKSAETGTAEAIQMLEDMKLMWGIARRAKEGNNLWAKGFAATM